MTKKEALKKTVVLNFRCGKCRLEHSINLEEVDPVAKPNENNSKMGNSGKYATVVPNSSGLKKMESVLHQLEELPNETDLRKQVDVLTSSMTFIAQQYDTILELQKRVCTLESKIKLTGQGPPGREPRGPNRHSRDPHPARRDVVISQIPRMQEEKLENVALEVLRVVGCEAMEEDIESVERFASKATGEKHFIKIRFRREETKIKAIKCSRAKKAKVGQLIENIKKDTTRFTDASKIRFSTQRTDYMDWAIFINESVSKECKKILDSALRLKRSGRVASVWTNNNRVHLIEKEGANVSVIHSLDFLQRTFGPIPQAPSSTGTERQHVDEQTIYTDM